MQRRAIVLSMLSQLSENIFPSPATQLTTRVLCKHCPWGHSVCLPWAQSSALAGRRALLMEPYPLPNNVCPFSPGGSQRVGGGVEGGRTQESGAVCFLLCVNNTTSVPQPGSWTKVKWCEHSLLSGSGGGEWERKEGRGAARAEASLNNNISNNENIFNTARQALCQESGNLMFWAIHLL
jgi:hypothetical protein